MWTGKTMQPIDPEPNPAGNLVLTGRFHRARSGDRVPVVEVQPQGGLAFDGEPAERYMPHHATCPNAGEFRR